MSDQRKGFAGLSIEQVQKKYFLRGLGRDGRYSYPSSGLNADPGTVVLFQFKARIIASALFLRDEKFERPRGGAAGVVHYDPSSIRTFDALDVDAMRAIWAGFRAFGHAKRRLNPMLYGKFKRRLKNVREPAPQSSPRAR
jgi:hypothetical protein